MSRLLLETQSRIFGRVPGAPGGMEGSGACKRYSRHDSDDMISMHIFHTHSVYSYCLCSIYFCS